MPWKNKTDENYIWFFPAHNSVLGNKRPKKDLGVAIEMGDPQKIMNF